MGLWAAATYLGTVTAYLGTATAYLGAAAAHLGNSENKANSAKLNLNDLCHYVSLKPSKNSVQYDTFNYISINNT